MLQDGLQLGSLKKLTTPTFATGNFMAVELFTPLTIRGITLRNRIAVSPMCQYSSIDGKATDWHLVHLGSRAVGGAGLVMVEATAVEDIGRISPQDMGLWNDEQKAALSSIADFIIRQGSMPAIQLAHAGRKASTSAPWNGGKPLSLSEGGWTPIGPSPIAFAEGYATPLEMTEQDILRVTAAFRQSARRSVRAGFKIIEIHSAHGYLLHSFLSPLSNKRTDQYGGSLENRMRFLTQVARAIREEIPEGMPLFVRISATDWADGGWDLEQSVALSQQLRSAGVDLIDCSSGALVPHVKIPAAPGYQVPFAEEIKRKAGIMTGAVGMITEPSQAEEIISGGKADIVLMAREMLRDPYWPLHAAKQLGVDIDWPVQYTRAKN